ncbi:MAG: TolC family protein [Cruoricaptor ignavus]|nr:TolC family protein [Cruoricaptor ignavus]
MKNNIIITLVLLSSFMAKSQTPISLDEAYDKAIKNNLNLKNGQLKIDFQEKNKRSYAVVEPLSVSGEIGQINSVYVDNAFSVSQTLRLPNFYKNQKKVLMEEWKNATLGLQFQKWQLKKELQLLYNELVFMDEKATLLQKAENIYSQYYDRAKLRLNKGESNILEKTTAENLRAQAKIQLANLQKDKEVVLHQFNFLINDEDFYTNKKTDGNFDFYQLQLSYNPQENINNISLKPLEQQIIIEKTRVSAEKNKLLPSFTVGVTSGTQHGIGADDKFYNRSKRFQTATVGIGLPIFNSAQKSVIEAQKINELIAENNYKLGVRNLENQSKKWFAEYEKLKQETDYYKAEGQQNATTIINTANRLYSEGEINYLEWSILVNQSLDLENRRIDAQKLLNDKIIELNNLNQ